MRAHADDTTYLLGRRGGDAPRTARRATSRRGIPALAAFCAALLLTTFAAPAGAEGPFALSSPAFRDGGPLPANIMWDGGDCRGLNVQPTLTWSNAPAGTRSFALTFSDPDAGQAIPSGWVHWIIYNVPGTTSTLDSNNASQFTQGETSFSAMGFAKPGFGGPCPSPNGLVHHYTFTLFALDLPQVAGQQLSREALFQAMDKHVLASTSLVGLFARQPPASAPAVGAASGVIRRLGDG